MSLDKIYINNEVAANPLVEQICLRLPDVPKQYVESSKNVFDIVSSSDNFVSEGKKSLYLLDNNGAFIKQCPGTKSYTCCDYQILHIGTFCTMDCSYCILQAYFHPPVLQFFVNHDRLFRELEKKFKSDTINRIGTGEYTDSLIWEQWTGLSPMLIEKFAVQNSSMLEIKTKTISINGLEGLNHNRKTVISWSLNTEAIIHSEERGTSSLSARLKSASKCEKWGYPVSFHFDPMFIYPGCEDEYGDVVQQIFKHVSAENIVWISLGSFRFMPDLKPIIQQRFDRSKIVYGEFVSGLDNKMRYFKPLRIKLYQKIASLIKEIAPDVMVYFCMEDDEVWKKSLGFLPAEFGGLPRMLDKSAATHCGLRI